jgi:hypothetical protein
MALLKALGLGPPSEPGALQRAAVLAAHLLRREDALDGPIAAARKLKLEPASLAKLRDKTFVERERRIAAAADKGRVAEADKLLIAWIDEADAWQDSHEAYAALGSAKPDTQTLQKLAQAKGGAGVLDALVDAVPEDAAPAAVAAALEARHGVRPVAPPLPPDSAAADPPAAPKSSKGLYKLLGRVPAGDAAAPVAVERIAPGSLPGQPAPALFAAAPAA